MPKRPIAWILFAWMLLASVSPALQATSAVAHLNPQSPSAQPASANPNAAANEKQQDCTVSGMVVAMAGSIPLKNALVILKSEDDHSRSEITIRSEADGHFQFRGIIPGQYRLRSSYSNGKRTFTSAGINSTNDLGEYRLFGLPPGRYFISATYHPGAIHAGPDSDFDFNGADTLKENYVLTYYPGTYDSTKAQSITVKSGEEIPSMDFMMRPTAVYRVRGRVINTIPDTKHVEHPMVFIMPRGGAIQSDSMTFGPNNGTKKDGAFELPGVAPGSYTIQAVINGEGEEHAVTQNIDIGDGDVDGLQLVISKGFSVSGHVRWDGTPGHIEDNLYLMGRMDGQSPMTAGYARVDRDGSFTWNRLSDGAMRIQFEGLDDNGYVKAAEYGGVNVLDQGFTPRAGSNATLEVTLSAQGAQVEGTGRPLLASGLCSYPTQNIGIATIYTGRDAPISTAFSRFSRSLPAITRSTVGMRWKTALGKIRTS